MNISDWPISKIMQLPDYAFGRREIVQLAMDLTDANAVYAISPAGLAERTVIWDIGTSNRGASNTTTHAALSLGDFLPTTDAQFNAMEVMFPGVIASDGGVGEFEAAAGSYMNTSKVRQVFQTSGRRFVARFIRHQQNATESVIVVAYSSIPTELPEWLCR